MTKNRFPKKLKVDAEKVLEVYKNNLGNVSATCEKCGISRRTFYNYIQKYPAFAEEVDFVNERNIDFAESMLLKNIREGKETSLIFYLKTKGKDRGYVERIEQKVEVNPFLELMQNLPADE